MFQIKHFCSYKTVLEFLSSKIKKSEELIIILLKLPEKKKKKTCHNKYTNFPKYISILGKRDVKTAKLPTWSISNFNSELLNFNLITFGSRTTNSFMPHETNPISFWVSNPRH